MADLRGSIFRYSQHLCILLLRSSQTKPFANHAFEGEFGASGTTDVGEIIAVPPNQER